MTLVRFQNRPNGLASFNNLLTDVLPQTPSLYKEEFRRGAAVNIKETKKDFVVEIVAPGLNREDFSINLEQNVLTVSVELREAKPVEGEKQIRKEFSREAFKRSFTMDEKINVDAISAQYVNGILTVNLPKKEEVKPVARQISVL
jgi:HSP20 family protein